jgi:hypothetical protein
MLTIDPTGAVLADTMTISSIKFGKLKLAVAALFPDPAGRPVRHPPRRLGPIKKAFDANGIKFAFPTVQVAGDTDATTAAVAQEALRLVKPAAAE